MQSKRGSLWIMSDRGMGDRRDGAVWRAEGCGEFKTQTRWTRHTRPKASYAKQYERMLHHEPLAIQVCLAHVGLPTPIPKADTRPIVVYVSGRLKPRTES